MEWQQYASRWVRCICRVRCCWNARLWSENPRTPAVASEIMVEGTVFLDEDDGVFDVIQFGANGWTGEAPPPPHPCRSTVASSPAAVAAPIFNKSRRVTFLEVMGSFVPSFPCVGLSKLTRYPSTPDVRPPPVIESSSLKERRGVQNSSCFPGTLLITLVLWPRPRYT